MRQAVWIVVLSVPVLVMPARACSLCGDNIQLSPTFRQEAAMPTARLILHGTIANPRTTGGVTGQTDFHIKTVLRSDPVIKGKEHLVLPRYLPLNDKGGPPHYLLFCDLEKDKIDPYRGVKIDGPATVEYVKKALQRSKTDAVENLVFFFRYLEDADTEVARDAFLEFAKANDADIARAAPRLDAGKLRTWLQDPKTPEIRLGVYALLLGGCGTEADTNLLRRLLESKEPRYNNAADGLLAGYMVKKPREGWDLLQSTLADGTKPLLLRLSMLRTLRFFHLAHPKESLPEVLKAMRTLVAQGDMADLAIEDMRHWGVWDLTAEVLGCFGKKGYESPLMQRAIVRYALCCKPTKETQAFLAARRAADPETVQQVQEGLEFEKRR